MQQMPAPTSTKCTYTNTNWKTHQSPPLTLTTPLTIYPPTKPTTPFNTHPVSTYIEPDNNNHDNITSRPTLLAIQFNAPCGLASISRQALYHVINLAFNASHAHTISQALSKSPNHVLNRIDIKEGCNGVVHPMTKEIITKYTKLNNPVLEPLLVPAMSKELHRLVQGKEGITAATNTIFFSPMTKPGASQRIALSPTCAL
jgi:hypothetical protein